MANVILFDDGFEDFTINNDPNRVIRINPKDLNILERLQQGMADLKTEAQKISEIKVNAQGQVDSAKGIGTDKAVELLAMFDKLVSEKMNYIFNADVSMAAFAGQSPLSLVGSEGKFLYEAFLEAVSSVIKEKIEASTADLEKKVEAYTSKYKAGPGGYLAAVK